MEAFFGTFRLEKFLVFVVFLYSCDGVHVHHNQRHHQNNNGFHYHYEVLGQDGKTQLNAVPQVSSTSPAGSPVESMKTEESRSSTAFGYRKPSGEYRVVDFLADGFGFNRKNSPVQYSTYVGSIPPPQPPSLPMPPPSTTSTTTVKSSTTFATTTQSTTTMNGDYDDEVEEVTPVRVNELSASRLPPSQIRSSTKGSPAQQARLLFQEHISSEDEEDGNEREVELVSQNNQSNSKKTKKKVQSPSDPAGVKGGMRENEISREKLQQQRLTTTKKPQAKFSLLSVPGPPNPTNDDRELVKSLVKNVTPAKLVQGNIRYDRPFAPTNAPAVATPQNITVSPTSTSTTSTTFTSTLPPSTTSMEQLQRSRSSPTSSIFDKISVHQLISEAMPTLQMSVVPVYFMNRGTKQVVAVPYLVMKSISKMPLIPNGSMFDSMTPVGRLSHFQNQRLSQSRVIAPTQNNGFNLLTFKPNIIEETGVSHQPLAQSVEESDDVSFEIPKKPSDSDEKNVNNDKLIQEMNQQNKAGELISDTNADTSEFDSEDDMAASASNNNWFALRPHSK